MLMNALFLVGPTMVLQITQAGLKGPKSWRLGFLEHISLYTDADALYVLNDRDTVSIPMISTLDVCLHVLQLDMLDGI